MTAFNLRENGLHRYRDDVTLICAMQSAASIMCIDTFLTLEGVTKDCRVPGLTATTYIQYSNKVLETKQNITHPSFANRFQVEERETQRSLGQKTLHDLLCKLLSIIDKKELHIFLYQPLSRVEISVSSGGQSHTFDNGK